MDREAKSEVNKPITEAPDLSSFGIVSRTFSEPVSPLSPAVAPSGDREEGVIQMKGESPSRTQRDLKRHPEIRALLVPPPLAAASSSPS